MGTRGKFGFFYKGKFYMAYNSLGSFPDDLGVRLILEIIHANLDEWIKLLENIKEVDDEEIEPTPEDIKRLEKYTDLSWGGSSKSWDNLLRHTQGSFYHTLHSGYLVNVNDYDVDEEYVYVLDFDNKEFRAKAVDEDKNFDVASKLETKELMKFAIEWSKGDLDEDYDPEKELAYLQERAKCRLEERKKSENGDKKN